MRRRSRSILLLLVLAVGAACFTVRERPVAELQRDDDEIELRDIRGWITRSGEVVRLPDNRGAELTDTALIVYLLPTPTARHRATAGDSVRIGAQRVASVPLHDVERILVHDLDGLGTAALVVVGGVAVLALAVAASSCPFIYVQQGDVWVAVAEPLGGAVADALQRTDLSRLEGIAPDGSVYRVVIANEMPETQHVDAFSLVAVDHAPGTRVLPDRSGRFWLSDDAAAPVRVTDQAGADLTARLVADDDDWWRSGGPGGLTADGRARDTLTLEFARPAADDARLLVHAKTSLWGAEMLKEMLALWGSDAPRWRAQLASSAGARALHEEWLLREEYWLLRVEVLERGGWVAQDVIVGGGPWISEAQAVPLDLSRVEGDVVRVRVAPPRGFWRIGWAALDVTPQARLVQHALAASEAVDWNGADVRALLATVDSMPVTMPERGQQVRLAFEAPPLADGLERTVFARTSGHYRIHLDESVPADVARLDSLWMQPGYGVHMAERAHRAWSSAHPGTYDLF